MPFMDHILISYGNSWLNKSYILNHIVVATIVRTPDRSENIDLFCLQNMISFHNVHETCRWLLCTTNIRWSKSYYLACPPFAAITAAHLSGIVSIYFLRISTQMLSNAFCNSRQRLSFECTIDLSNFFSNPPPKKKRQTFIHPQAIQDVDEFVSLSEQIWRNSALDHLLTDRSHAVNGCRQNESHNNHNKITIIHKYIHTTPSIN